MELTVGNSAGGIVVRVAAARIDAASAIAFKDGMKALTDACEGRVLLDLAEVGFIDSSGLGAIVASMKQLGAGRRLELASLTPPVAKVFRLTRLDTVFPIHATPGEAGMGA
jgi:anti-sigma B factor antagonist